MKRWKKILLAVVIVLVVSVAAVCVWQWDNIRAAYLAFSQDSEQISENVQKKRDELQQAIEEKVPVTVTPPTTEQSDSLLDRQITPDEVKDQLGITDLLEQGEQDKQGEGSSQPPAQSEEKLVNLCLAEMYACKIDLMAVLAQLKQEAVDEWRALPGAERTPTRKLEIGLDGLTKCYELEDQVDAQVKEILDRYREKLSAIGGDPAVMDILWQYYQEEKDAEKAYYINKYMN